MTWNKGLAAFVAISLAAAVAGCRPGDSSPDAAATEAEGHAPGSEAPAAAPPEVTYEPAFPADVSEEGLSEGDVAQQETVHSHGDEEHTHGDDETDHVHGGAQDDPPH